jgi:hypothetical protein
MRTECLFTSWRNWGTCVDRWVQEFHKLHGVYPDLLAANQVTFRRLNMAADKAHVRDKSGQSPAAYAELKGFAGKNYSLHFVEEADIPDNEFSLIKVENG